MKGSRGSALIKKDPSDPLGIGMKVDFVMNEDYDDFRGSASLGSEYIKIKELERLLGEEKKAREIAE